VLMGAGRFALRCRSGACGCPCRCLTRLRAGRTCSAMFRQGRSFHKSCSCGQLTGLTPTLGHHHAGTLGMPLSGLSPQHVTVNTNALASRSCEQPCVVSLWLTRTMSIRGDVCSLSLCSLGWECNVAIGHAIPLRLICGVDSRIAFANPHSCACLCTLLHHVLMHRQD
jgi:hypothetical protein